MGSSLLSKPCFGDPALSSFLAVPVQAVFSQFTTEFQQNQCFLLCVYSHHTVTALSLALVHMARQGCTEATSGLQMGVGEQLCVPEESGLSVR